MGRQQFETLPAQREELAEKRIRQVVLVLVLTKRCGTLRRTVQEEFNQK